MFVTIRTYRARPGEEDAIVALHEDWQMRRSAGVPGFLSGELLRSARDLRLFVDILRFESEEWAEAYARDPEQRAWRRRLASLSESEPDEMACSVEWWWTVPPNWTAHASREKGGRDPRSNRPSSSVHIHPRSEEMTAQDNAQITRTMYNLFEQQRFDEALEYVAGDAEVVPFYAPGLIFRGKDGFRDFMASHKNALPDIRVQIDNQVATDTTVVNECTATGTHTGPLVSPAGEIPPTGRKVTLHFCEVWQLRDGKVVSLHNYQDSGDLLSQLGLMPEPQAAGA